MFQPLPRVSLSTAMKSGLKEQKCRGVYLSVSGWICIREKYYLGQDEVLHWIADFDRDKPVKPITIELVDTYVLEKYRPKFFVHTLRRRDTRKARETPAPPDLQVCGIARIAD